MKELAAEEGNDLLEKRMDKMRYYGSLGKRFHAAEKKNSGIIYNSKKSKIDRLRYMGSLGRK